MEGRMQLDLLITSLVLIRKASTAVDAALGLPAADRTQLDAHLDAIRHDLSRVVEQVGNAIPEAGGLTRRPEMKAAAGVVEFVARQGASQLGVVAGVADAIRGGGDSRELAGRIERHLAEVGVASRDDLAAALRVDPDSPQLQEGLERALGSGRAEWYGPGVYGVPRGELEELSSEALGGVAAAEGGEAVEREGTEAAEEGEHLQSAVNALERSLRALGGALGDTGGSGEAGSDQIRALRRLAEDGVISAEEFERKKAEILARM